MVNSSYMKKELGYPTGFRITIPDKYGKTSSGIWVLWEEKAKDTVEWALRQLDDGVRNLKALGRPVGLLGVSVEKLDRKEPWVCNHLGYLMRRDQIGEAPHPIDGMPVMIEQRRR